jgi:hypothetical protein
MKQLTLEFTELGPLYKCEEGIYYQFNSSGDLVFLSEDKIEGSQVWDYARGTFQINADRIITQTQEYYDKYYVCSKKEEIHDRTGWKEKEIDKIYVALSAISADQLSSQKDLLSIKRYESLIFLLQHLDRI